MKFNQYLTEQDMDFDAAEHSWKKTVLPLMVKNCGKFLKEKVLLFRGTLKDVEDITFVIPRKDRKPLDTAPWVHRGFDDGSQKVFGWKARSEGVLVTGDSLFAYGYGHESIFVPKGDYKYIWSPEIKDLFDKYKSDLRDNPKARGDEADPNFWEGFVNNHYQNHGLKKASHIRKQEIMFHCPKGYYLINKLFEDDITREFKLQ